MLSNITNFTLQRLFNGDIEVNVVESGVPKHYRLCYCDPTRSGTEVKFSMDGYIIQKSLPPILNVST